MSELTWDDAHEAEMAVPFLRSGKGGSPENGGCVMEVASWVVNPGEWTDNPECVHPVIRTLAIHVNDILLDDERQKLLDLIPRMIGTASGDVTLTRKLQLGLVAPDGAKGWAEIWCPSAEKIPVEGSQETLILAQPDNPEWLPKASRPKGGAGGGGGFKGKSPADLAAERASIEAQVAFKGAVEYAVSKGATPDDIVVWPAQFAEAIREAKP